MSEYVEDVGDGQLRSTRAVYNLDNDAQRLEAVEPFIGAQVTIQRLSADLDAWVEAMATIDDSHGSVLLVTFDDHRHDLTKFVGIPLTDIRTIETIR